MGNLSETNALPRDQVTLAIARAGITGITEKQLGTVTRLPTESIHDRLGDLVSAKRIVRIGRGLWVLDRFATVDSREENFRGSEWYQHSFARTFRIKIGVREGEIQFTPNERRPVHRWWPYVQGFSAGFVEETCRTYRAGRKSTVLDPFCGSGTVPITARSLGAQGIGIDRMPIASFVTEAKGIWEVDPKALSTAARRLVDGELTPSSDWRPFLRETRRQFRPEVLRSLLGLRETLWRREESDTTTLLKLAFASILIDSSNLHRSPCLGYGKKKNPRAETPRELFEAAACRIAEDLEALQRRRASWGPRLQVLHGDAGMLALPEGSVDLAITSPPYVNGMDYAMNYKIDLAWMGFVTSYEELASLRASMVACDNIPRHTASDHALSDALRGDVWLREITRSIEHNIRTKGSYRRDDMAAVVRKYFDDLVPVVRNVLTCLKPGSRFVVVNGDSLIAGTYIPGDLLFARIGRQAGFRVERFDVARVRRSGQRRSFLLRESVLTLRKPTT